MKTSTKSTLKIISWMVGVFASIVGIIVGIHEIFGKAGRKSEINTTTGEEGVVIAGSGNNVTIYKNTVDSTANQPMKKVEEDENYRIPSDHSSHKNVLLSNTIAILPFENVSESQNISWVGRAIPEVLTQYIANIGTYVVVENNLRDKVIQEIDFQQGKYVDKATAVKIGRQLGVSKVILGSFQSNNGNIIIVGRIINVEYGTVDKDCIIEESGAEDQIYQLQKQFSINMAECLKESNNE